MFVIQALGKSLHPTSYDRTAYVMPRKIEGTEREAQAVGRDMSCARKLFLDVRVHMLSPLHPPLHEIFAFISNIRPRLACMRTSRKTDLR